MAIFSGITYYKSNLNNQIIAATNSGGGTPTEEIGIAAVTTGTITTVIGNTAVTGVGTLFSTEAVAGKYLFTPTGTYIGKVASVGGNTSLTLEVGGAYATVTTGAYVTKTLLDGVLIGQELMMRVPVKYVDTITRTIPKISFLRNPNGALTSSNTDTAYIQLTLRSTESLPGVDVTPVTINTTIERLNTFTQVSLPSGNYFPLNTDLPSYIWYKLNPYGTTSATLPVYARFKLYVAETLPDINITTNMPYVTINNGDY